MGARFSVHKWHWYTFRIEQSQSIIMHLEHSLAIAASSYKAHALVIAVHCVWFELFPHFVNH